MHQCASFTVVAARLATLYKVNPVVPTGSALMKHPGTPTRRCFVVRGHKPGRLKTSVFYFISLSCFV